MESGDVKRFKNILVIPDKPFADDATLQRAAKLASNTAARITILWPLEQSSDGGTGLEFLPEITGVLKDWLENLAQPLRNLGLLVDSHVRVGRPFLEIIRQVDEAGHDLVVRTAGGWDTDPTLIFGSTALHLLRKCPCPVWMVDPARGEQNGVLAAVDTDTDDPQRQAINRKIMQLATSLASFEGRPVHAVHAWNVPYEDLLFASPRLHVDPMARDAHKQQIENRCRSRFDALLNEFDVVAPDLTKHFVKGAAGDVISEVAEMSKIDVIVMATVARTGIRGLFIGDTAEGLLQRVKCGVLAIKPDGFVSPVLS